MKKIKRLFIRASKWTWEQWEDDSENFVFWIFIILVLTLLAGAIITGLVFLFIQFPLLISIIFGSLAFIIGIPVFLVQIGKRYDRLEINEGWE